VQARPEDGLSRAKPTPPIKPAPAAKPVPPQAPPAPGRDKSPARDQEISQAVQSSNQQAQQTARNQDIQQAVKGLEKGLAAKARDQAYRDAVGEAAGRIAAGKVSAQVSRGGSGRGGGSGSAGGGSPGSGLTLAYGQRIAKVIRGHWNPNCLQRSNLKALKAVIIVRVSADGAITASWFERESGDRLYDQAAMSAVTRANPLPPLPAGQEQLEIGITFSPEWKASS
jgi:TonB family protein